MANGLESLSEEYAGRVDALEFGAMFEPPVYHALENPDDPDGPPLYGPSKDDLRGTQIVRTEDHRIPQGGVQVDTPGAKFLFLAPPPEYTPRKIILGDKVNVESERG